MMASSDFSRIAARRRIGSCGAWNPSLGFSDLMVWPSLRLARGVTWSVWHRFDDPVAGTSERLQGRPSNEGAHRLRPILEALEILPAWPEQFRTSRSSRSVHARTVRRPTVHVRIASATGLKNGSSRPPDA